MINLSATDAVAAMRDGDITAEAYAEALLARCEAGQALNAFIAIRPDFVREAARAADLRRRAGEPLGLLHGLPIPIKDSINTSDLPTTAGTNALRGFQPADDAPAVARLKAAGANVLGKTNLHELSFGWTSDNQAFGAVRNPYDPSRIPGGSSGGTAAAVAARMAPLGVAEDTQGSIRVPAALCGICGFRPTTGRYSTDGAAPITALFDQIGPHARDVIDLALFDSVMMGDTRPIVPARLQGLRLGVARGYFFTGLDTDLASVVEKAMARLSEAGVTFVDIELPGLSALVDRITMAVQAHDVAPSLARYLQDYGAPVDFAGMLEQVSPDVLSVLKQIALPGAPFAIPEAIYQAAREQHLPALKRMMADYFSENRLDAMILPTTMIPATKIGEDDSVLIAGNRAPFMTAISRNISPGSTAGLPGLVLPAGLTEESRLPVGLEIDGPERADRAVLAIGLAFESVLGTIPPPSGLSSASMDR